MNRHDLIVRLLELPALIAQAEADLLTVEERRRVAGEALQRTEDELIVAGVEGKNEAVRQAIVRAETVTEREMVTACDYRVSEARIRRSQLINEFSALRSVARLLEAER